MKRTEYVCGHLLAGAGILITGFLSLYSLFFTTEFVSNAGEELIQIRGTAGIILLLMMLSFFLLAFSVKWIMYREAGREKRIRILRDAVVFYAVFYGILWAWLCKYEPMWDQEEVSLFAEYLASGVQEMDEGRRAYITMYPHQLGLMVFLGQVYRLFGQGNFFAFQLLNALGAGGIVYLGYGIVCRMTGREEAGVCFLFLMLSCHPLYIYVCYVYGEVLSVAGSFLAISALFGFLESGKKRYAVLLAAALTVSCLIRSNCAIVLIAVICVLLVKAFAEKKLRYMSVAILTVAAFLLSRTALNQYYENRMEISLQNGLPSVVWLAMGLQSNGEKSGWYNGYSHYVYLELAEGDAKKAEEIGKISVKESLKEFQERPVYAVDFFYRKIVSQWNEPTYAALEVTNCEKNVRNSWMERIYKGDLWKAFVRIMDAYQSLIYTGAFLFMADSVRKKKTLEVYLWLIIVLGGFLFYLFWEAKSRYILPYYIAMIPMAACGYDLLIRKIPFIIKQNSRKRDTDE